MYGITNWKSHCFEQLGYILILVSCYHLCTSEYRLLELDKLKQRILTGTPSEQMEVVDELVATNNEDAVELFIRLLESTDPQVRNSVALGIYELKSQAALEPLLTAIFKP